MHAMKTLNKSPCPPAPALFSLGNPVPPGSGGRQAGAALGPELERMRGLLQFHFEGTAFSLCQ